MSPNTLSFIGLCQEYCTAVENAASTEPAQFTAAMLRLLPRIYITATDLADTEALDERFIEGALSEDYYDAVRRDMENLFGPDDTYLETFEQDMKYSDTPIAASLSEGLADLFQEFYDFLAAVRDATDETVDEAVGVVRDDFAAHWSRTLCNVMRPLNALRYGD